MSQVDNKIVNYLKKNKDKLLSGGAVVVIVVMGIIGARLFIDYLKTRPIPLKKADIKTGFLYEAASSDITIRLGKQKTNTPVIEVSSGKAAMSFIFDGAKKTTTPPTQKNNSLLFSDIRVNTDLRYTTLPNGIKEEIILKKKQQSGLFYFLINTAGATPKKSVTNSYYTPVFYDAKGNYVFHMLKPFAIDAKGARTNSVILQIQKGEIPNTYIAVISVDEGWFTSKDRAYPITVDPSVVYSISEISSSDFTNGQFNRVSNVGIPVNPGDALATGGTITRIPGTSYVVHTFYSSGTFVPSVNLTVDYLVVGGGGGGGGRHGGGGGGGQVNIGTRAINAGSYPVVVGAGGAGAQTDVAGGNGESSSFIDTANGGGGGGAYGGATYPNGRQGGSGGGGGHGPSTGAWSAKAMLTNGTSYGNAGGNGGGNEAGGGGGAGAAGQTGVSESYGGAGGSGILNAINGTYYYWGGGGGGGGWTQPGGNGGIGGGGGGGRGDSASAGGSGGGAAINSGSAGIGGYSGAVSGGAGGANTGGGGGGGGQRDYASYSGVGGNGGSGIVIIRYSNPNLSANLETDYQELTSDANTVGLWHMNEASGNIVDASGNGHTGTVTGTTVVAGKFGNGRYFDGTNSYIDAGQITPTNITISAWINHQIIAGHSTTYTIFSSSRDCCGTYNGIEFDIANNYYLMAISWNGTATYLTSSTKLEENTWYHVALTHDGSMMKIYINGVLDKFGSAPAIGQPASHNGFIGRAGIGNGINFAGTIDEVRVSSVARTPEEIKADAQRRPYSIYTSDVIDLQSVESWTSLSWEELGVKLTDGETPKDTTGLVAQWNFNETSGTTANNNAGSCGANCNGTLTNFADTSRQDPSTSTLSLGGNSISYIGTQYVVHTFTSTGTFTPNVNMNADVLVVGGGGGGGAYVGGGGGGGGVYMGTATLTAGTAYTITVGGGGSGGSGGGAANNTNGGNSSITGGSVSLTAIGGGTGGRYANGGGTAGGSGGGGGGCEGGSSPGGAGQQPSSANGGYGNAGGTSTGTRPNNDTEGRGGGGGGAAGGNTSCWEPGDGGNGVASSITGTTYYYGGGGGGGGFYAGDYGTTRAGNGGYGGGGGGGAYTTGSPGVGGKYGTSAGESPTLNMGAAGQGIGGAGAPNTGGGGGGCGHSDRGGNGGSGVVIIRYPLQTSDVSGWTTNKKWGAGALSFDGENDLISLGGGKFDDLTNASLEMWFKYTGTFDTNRTLFSHFKDWSNRQLLFVGYPGGWGNKLVFENIIGGVNRGIKSDTTLTIGNWYHVVISCGSEGMKMYLNGVQQKSTAATTDCFSSAAPTGSNEIGVIQGLSLFKGTIDSMRMYSRTLTLDEIVSNYNNGTNVELQTRVGDALNNATSATDTYTDSSLINTGSSTTYFINGGQASICLEPTPPNTYLDADGDGYGTGSPVSCRDITKAYVSNNTDCNDSLAGYNNTLPDTYYTDVDGDSYTVAASAGTARCSTTTTWDASTSVSSPGSSSFTSFTAGARKNTGSALADCDDASSTIHATIITGGTITYTDSNGLNPRSSPRYTNGYKIHTFTGSSNLIVSCPASLSNVRALIVAGGGGGGGYMAGGGGAGGVLASTTLTLTPQTYTVTVGNGGGNSANGQNSSVAGLTAIGGGAGGTRDGQGVAGGSGGGAGSSYVVATNGGAGTAGQGNRGGNVGVFWSAAGGGGCGGVGANATDSGAAGGIGCQNNISGINTYYGGGGGGASNFTPGVGGQGGGGNGGGHPGTANTGGGGGGDGAAGGSGIVIIRYSDP